MEQPVLRGRPEPDVGNGLLGKRLLVLLVSAFFLALPEGVASDNFKRGMESYKSKDYKAALNYLHKAAGLDPYNAEIHYYLANTHIFLQDGKSAIKEYGLCFDLEPLSKFGQYSRQALLAFGKKFQGFVADDKAEQKHLAPDDPASIKQAVLLIGAQAGERDNLNHCFGQGAAKTAVEVGESQQQRLNLKAQELMEDLKLKPSSPALEEELHEIQQRAVFDGQRARQDAQQQAARHMSEAVQRSTAVESSASNLLSLISESPRAGHVKVKAAGTNLYVRNYGSEPSAPLQALMASWQLMPKGSGKSKSETYGRKNYLERDRMELTELDGRIFLHLRDDGIN